MSDKYKSVSLKSELTDKRVQKAFEDLVKLGLPINFTTVAKRAGVSRQYLYKSEKWKSLILQARDNEIPSSSENPEQIEITRLKLELVKLKKENEKLQKQIDEPHLYIGKANKLEKENAELKAKNSQLRKKITELERQLETAYKL